MAWVSLFEASFIWRLRSFSVWGRSLCPAPGEFERLHRSIQNGDATLEEIIYFAYVRGLILAHHDSYFEDDLHFDPYLEYADYSPISTRFALG